MNLTESLGHVLELAKEAIAKREYWRDSHGKEPNREFDMAALIKVTHFYKAMNSK